MKVSIFIWRFIGTLCLAITLGISLSAHAEFLDDFPHLKQYVFTEKKTNFFFGFGASPLRLTKNKAGIALNVFDVYWQSPHWDLELLNVSFGTTLSGESTSNVRSFTFRASPRLRFLQRFSLGPVVGVELVEFPDITARIGRNNLYTPIEPFSSRGFIYGACMSEDFDINENYRLKLHQLMYFQTYSTTKTSNGWEFAFTDADLNSNHEPIAPGVVISLEASLLY